MGLITPPVGLNVFIINGMAKGVPMGHTFRGVSVFLVSDVLRVVLLVAAPVLTLGLPRLFK
jgi:TRAP-type C4-dicarboxylate transport system permease large subunit